MSKEKTKKNSTVKTWWKEFKAFISRGNILDLAVGVIIGGAFNAIVTAFTSILMSVCTWGVPGGLSGLVTVLPAANENQKAPSNIMLGGEPLKQVYSTTEWLALSQNADGTGFNNTIAAMYTKHGGSYYFSNAAIIDWGAFINAIISFLIIALTLFVIIKVVNYLQKKREALKAQALEAYYEKHPEERPVPEAPAPAKPTTEELLTAILEELKKKPDSGESAK